MGAAASIERAYKDAIIWFREYFTSDLYLEDFRAIDKDRDGGLRLSELDGWLNKKAKTDGGPWKFFSNNPEIITMAYNHSSKYMSDQFLAKKKIVEIADFRTLLVHLFVVSILYTHFKHADSCQDCGDSMNNMLSVLEFKLAIRTFCTAYGQEEMSDQQILKDFQLLDIDKSGSISFGEICHFCCKFIDPTYKEKRETIICKKGSYDPATDNPEDHLDLLLEANSSVDDILQVPKMQRNASLITASAVEATFTPRTASEEGRGHHHGEMVRRQSVSQKRAQLAKATSQLPPMEIMKELNTPLQQDELDHIIVVKKSDYKDATTAAMESMVEELNKHTNIGQYAEIRFSTEIALGMDHITELAQAHAQQQEAQPGHTQSQAQPQPQPQPQIHACALSQALNQVHGHAPQSYPHSHSHGYDTQTQCQPHSQNQQTVKA